MEDSRTEQLATPSSPRGPGGRRHRPGAWTAMVILQTFILVASLILPAAAIANEAPPRRRSRRPRSRSRRPRWPRRPRRPRRPRSRPRRPRSRPRRPRSRPRRPRSRPRCYAPSGPPTIASDKARLHAGFDGHPDWWRIGAAGEERREITVNDTYGASWNGEITVIASEIGEVTDSFCTARLASYPTTTSPPVASPRARPRRPSRETSASTWTSTPKICPATGGAEKRQPEWAPTRCRPGGQGRSSPLPVTSSTGLAAGPHSVHNQLRLHPGGGRLAYDFLASYDDNGKLAAIKCARKRFDTGACGNLCPVVAPDTAPPSRQTPSPTPGGQTATGKTVNGAKIAFSGVERQLSMWGGTIDPRSIAPCAPTRHVPRASIDGFAHQAGTAGTGNSNADVVVNFTTAEDCVSDCTVLFAWGGHVAQSPTGGRLPAARTALARSAGPRSTCARQGLDRLRREEPGPQHAARAPSSRR